jgi:aspartyl-tRNA(Asn)/glutamyl-tRNA(Gln) amidotransferase subunit B
MRETVIIGLEVHVQLLTQTKIFCGCANRFNPDQPNTQTCPVCTGMPGALPVMNRRAYELAVMTGMALGCQIAPFTKWDRKQYYYPDLPKAYQISQYDLPFSHDGCVELESESGETVPVRLNRAHLEEDAGKNIHQGNESFVDLNRCGTPLVEIVTEPDLRSAADARRFLEELRLLLTYLGVSDCNMQEGSLRCDANVNLHIETEGGQTAATPIVEIKNLNSFRAVEAAIEFEVERQRKEFAETGRRLGDPGSSKQTRGWDENRSVTFAQRGKEEAEDYRYFPDPDLVPVTITEEQIDEIRQRMCEFPAVRRERFRSQMGLSDYDAAVVIEQGRDFADYFEAVVADCGDGKQAANWVTQDVLRELNERKLGVQAFPIQASLLAALLKAISDGDITTKSARTVFAELLKLAEGGEELSTARIDAIIDAHDLRMVSDTGALEGVIDAVLAKNEKNVEDFRGGKQGAIGPLIGQVMREVSGADAKVVRQMLIEKING